MICIKCGKEFSEEWRSKSAQRKAPLLYCSFSCARSRFHSPEKKERIRNSLLAFNKKEKEVNPNKNRRVSSFSRESEATSILQLSKRTMIKILKRMKLSCSNCNWFVEDVSLDVHHILPVKQGGLDEHSNLSYLCPNCHRLVHSGKIKSTELVPLNVLIGDKWKSFYYIKKNGNSNITLLELALSSSD